MVPGRGCGEGIGMWDRSNGGGGKEGWGKGRGERGGEGEGKSLTYNDRILDTPLN